MRALSTLLFSLALAASAFPARGATLLAEFALRGSLDDNLGGPALKAAGGQVTSLGYIFAANQGLSLTNTVLSPDNYSIELSFSFAQTSGYRKIIDFRNLASDGGFYELNGALNFYPVTTASRADFSDGALVHVVLTRDGASGIVTGYVNGEQRITFSDPGGSAVFTTEGPLVQLLTDDLATGQREASSGSLLFLRFYNGALNPAEVSASFLAGPPAAVPEPATVALLALGLTLTLLSRRRRPVR